jgi:hypothetical protein
MYRVVAIRGPLARGLYATFVERQMSLREGAHVERNGRRAAAVRRCGV